VNTGRLGMTTSRSLILAAAALLSACAHDTAIYDPSRYSDAKLFAVYCSSCHGLDAHGSGPAQPFIAAHAPDLTQIAARRGGVFPAEEVYQIIDGQTGRIPHDSRHMPDWGYEFFSGDADDAVAHGQAINMEDRLVNYLKSIQQPPPHN
jgi:mono/diheme cytochrome c family protein